MSETLFGNEREVIESGAIEPLEAEYSIGEALFPTGRDNGNKADGIDVLTH